MDCDKISRLVTNGRFKEAIQLLSIKTTENEDDWHTHYLLGFCYRGVNDFGKAIDHYQKAASLNPKEHTIYLNLGIALQLNHDYRKALITLKEAIKIKDDYVLAYNSIGMTCRKMGNLEEANSWYEKGINKLFGHIFRELSQQNTLDAERVGFKGLPEGRWIEGAFEVLMYYSVKDDCELVTFPTGESATKYYDSNEYGGLYYIDKDTPEGKARIILPNYLDAFHKMLRSESTYSVLLNNMGSIFLELEDFDQAEKHFIESIHFIPEGFDYPPPFIGLDRVRELK